MDTQVIDLYIEDTIIFGDPVIVYGGNTVKVGSVFKLKVGESDMKTIKGEDLQNENIVVKYRELELEEIGDVLVWKGNFISEVSSIPGKLQCISTEVVFFDGIAFQKFDKSLMYDIGIRQQMDIARSFNIKR